MKMHCFNNLEIISLINHIYRVFIFIHWHYIILKNYYVNSLRRVQSTMRPCIRLILDKHDNHIVQLHFRHFYE